MRYLFIFLLVAVTNSHDVSPTGKDSKTFTVYINYPTCSVRAEVLKEASSVHTQEGCMYYWYSNNDIRSTENGFDGKLLHGEYRAFYPDLNLEEQGEFRYGRKTGLWKTWFPGGKIHELIHYKAGNKNGIMLVYNKEGYLVSETEYKNGKKSGKQFLYQDGKMDTVLKYRNDELVIKKKKTKDSAEKDHKDRKQKDTTSQKRMPGPMLKKVLKKNHPADTLKPKAPGQKNKTDHKPGTNKSSSK